LLYVAFLQLSTGCACVVLYVPSCSLCSARAFLIYTTSKGEKFNWKGEKFNWKGEKFNWKGEKFNWKGEIKTA
jgi:hypothetical protein